MDSDDHADMGAVRRHEEREGEHSTALDIPTSRPTSRRAERR